MRASERPITRRDFSKTAFLFAAGLSVPTRFSHALEPERSETTAESARERFRYRAVSWWLSWDDLSWPNSKLIDKIRRRADRCSANAVNCCLIFGAHFRWDFLPLWSRLHDELHFIREELHQRGILLFDHHSSVLTHRPRNQAEALNISKCNEHHVPFYPSLAEAAQWRYNGSQLNDWRMLDVQTGRPLYLPDYNAEQYCMNNPAFRAAYADYLKRLTKETAIDGLMSDDAIFYGAWRACGCKYCRRRFKKEHGHRLPPVTDLNFWGNRRNPAFRDWIAMRYETSGDFLITVKEALPPGFPLLTCCSSSDGYSLPAYGMSYQDFIGKCNHVLLEMAGSTPSASGAWDERAPAQLLHLGIARDAQAPCIGLGYGFFADSAFFIWALNKFLGSDCWFSTLKGRLGGPSEQIDALGDDADLIGECYRWERDHPQLFNGRPETSFAIVFSRPTRDFYAQIAGDYASDYAATCLTLVRANISCNVVTAIPEFGRTTCLLLSSVSCLSAAERQKLLVFLGAGGTVIATGPCGYCDERANPLKTGWLAEFGLSVEWNEPSRPGGFPPYSNFRAPLGRTSCRIVNTPIPSSNAGWFEILRGKGRLLWRPERISQHEVGERVIALVETFSNPTTRIEGLPPQWRWRKFRDGQRLLIHALPAKVEPIFHPTLQNQFTSERVIEKLKYSPLFGKLTINTQWAAAKVAVHSPDLSESRPASRITRTQWSVSSTGIRRYFVIECENLS